MRILLAAQVKLTSGGFPKEVVQSLRLLAAPSDEAANAVTGPSAISGQITRRPERQVALVSPLTGEIEESHG